MDSEQIRKLKHLGIDVNQCSLDIFDNLLELCTYLFEELEIKEEDRFKYELFRLTKNPTN